MQLIDRDWLHLPTKAPAPPAEPKVLNLVDALLTKAADRSAEIDVGYIYVIEAEGIGRYKIGLTNGLKNRLNQYATTCPVQWWPVMVATVPLDRLSDIERNVHELLGHYRVKGKWFAFGPEKLPEVEAALRLAAKQPINQSLRYVRAKFTKSAVHRLRAMRGSW
jgi:hypothetical protein